MSSTRNKRNAVLARQAGGLPAPPLSRPLAPFSVVKVGLAAVLLIAGGCVVDDPDEVGVSVGSKAFTEAVVLGEVVAQPPDGPESFHSSHPGTRETREDDQGDRRPKTYELAHLNQKRQFQEWNDHKEKGETPENAHDALIPRPDQRQ